MQNTYQFISDKGVFSLPGAADYSDLYFPVAGECGIKSAVTPTLGGDCKLDQNTFLLEPVSVENLHNNRSQKFLVPLRNARKLVRHGQFGGRNCKKIYGSYG